MDDEGEIIGEVRYSFFKLGLGWKQPLEELLFSVLPKRYHLIHSAPRHADST
jgi:hypothetical protein